MPTVDKETGVITDDAEAAADAAENEHERTGEPLAARYDHDEPDEPDETEPAVDPEPTPAPEPLTQKQLEAIGRKIDAAAATHENALRRILGDDFNEWLPCPLCMTDGHFAPMPAEQRDPAQVQAVLAALGQDGYSELREATWLVRCDTCDGQGRVRTPSHSPENAVVNCRDCASRGYNEKPPTPVAVPAWTPPAPAQFDYSSSGGPMHNGPDAWGKPAGHPQWGIDLNAVG